MTCPYCQQPAILTNGSILYQRRKDLARKLFWVCFDCDAYVGCHGLSDRPLGRLANADLRVAKSQAHQAFDPFWKSHGWTRGAAYQWLAGQLGIPATDCHIGMFDEEQCRRVIEACGQPDSGLRGDPIASR